MITGGSIWNGWKFILDSREIKLPAYNIDGKYYFKLRDMSETFNFTIEWNESANRSEIKMSNRKFDIVYCKNHFIKMIYLLNLIYDKFRKTQDKIILCPQTILIKRK